VTSPTPPRRAPLRAAPGTVGVGQGRLLSGRYRLESLVASGGMAQVWQGTDEVLRRRVAVKVLHPHLAADATFVARFRQEAVAAARLAHPGIVSIYDTCSDDGVEAIVMELVSGRTLRQRIDDPMPIDPWQAAGLAAQVAEALDAAHRAGLVHRDVKPANVLLCGDGRVKVADFGIAKAVAEADLTQPGLMVGTAKYLAPEQVRGEPVDARTDIYSLGVVLYEMLCGRAPFTGDTDAAVALARLQRDALRPRQVRAGIPRGLEDVVCRAMAREPADRFATAADLRAALLAAGAAPTPDGDLTATQSAIVSDRTAMAAPPVPNPGAVATATVAAPSFRRSERSLVIPTVIVVVVAVALGIAGLLLGRSGAGDLLNGVKSALGGSSSHAQVKIVSATAFDPVALGGDGKENDAQAPAAIDGNDATAWHTEGYDNPDITKLKKGVGLILSLGSSAALQQLQIDSQTNNWKFQVYVATGVPSSFAGWGSAVFTSGLVPRGNNFKVELKGARGDHVLVWILDRGDGPGRASAEIDEARLYA
jgi:tRNA A-37 threonylcarbamoyl transferase component Bud32